MPPANNFSRTPPLLLFLRKLIVRKYSHFQIINTVKLGYNELGYNEHPVITNKLNILGWYRSF